LDRVISSYTPIIRALGYARDRVKQSKQAQSGWRVLIAVMVETPSMSPLPFCAKEEADAINTLLPESIPREILLKRTRADLLEKINQCSIAHFSCHGGVASNPSKSKIYLQDWQTNPLTIGDIAALKLDHAQPAYLSAYRTTSSIDYRLLDEAIHMAGA
jgi:CHAT domain-containing protein